MTDKQIIIDEYFTECTDEGGGTIGYYLISETALIKKIREQNEYIKAKEQECEELKREICIRSCANIELSLEFKKYKKALDEIEEIADNNYEIAEMKQIFLIIGGLDV